MRELPSTCRSPLDSLYQAEGNHEFVRIKRSIEGSDDVVGYVVVIEAAWVVLSVFNGGSANGWVSLRLADVVSVTLAPGGRFVRSGLEYRRSWPAEAPDDRVSLALGAPTLIASAASHFSLVTLFDEREDPYHCFVGRPISGTSKRLEWQEMDLVATWGNETFEWDVGTITRVDFGGRYETALARVAQLRGI